MFGRRRHRAPVVVAPPAPVPVPGIELSEEQLFEKVRARLDAHMGSTGDWTLVRRSDRDTDTFFHEMAAFSLARQITSAIVGAPVAARDTAETAPDVAPTITVQAVAATASGTAVDVAPESWVAPAADSSATAATAEHIMFELNTVAVWADPQRHDPSHVDQEMVTPSRSASKRRWNGTRVS